MKVQYVVVEFVQYVEPPPPGEGQLILVEPWVAQVQRRDHRECNYKLADEGTLIVFPMDGRQSRDEPGIGPVGGYAKGVWRRYWYEYRNEPATDPRDGKGVYHSGDRRG